MIKEGLRERLYQYLGGVARQEFGSAMMIGGTDNHVHGLESLRTEVSIAEAARKWKTLSSVWVHETASRGEFGWQGGYGAFSVSPSNAESVKGYIEGQVEHHRAVTFEEEFVTFLERHGIEYDPTRVFE